MSADPRKIAAQALEHILKHQGFSKVVLSHALDKSQLTDRDKAFCTELLYGTLRWLPVLESSIQRAMNRPNPKLVLDLKCHLLVAAYQLQHLDQSIPAYAAVSVAVNAIKKKRPGMAGFANAILRNLGSAPHFLLKPNSSLAEIGLALGLPVFLLESLPKAELLEAAVAMNSRPQTWHWAPGQADGDKHSFVPNATLTPTNWVQDPASQVAGLLLNPTLGDYVIDACAAPGSKSRILKQAVGPAGRVLAIDQNSKRLGFIDRGIEALIGDFRLLELEPADGVLLDAPCSGFGTLRRHPEIKFWRTLDDIDRLAKLQAELLDAAAKVVKPGGVLVYSVCSPLPQEGSEQIKAFLERHPRFRREPPRDALAWLPEYTVNALDEIRLWPHRDQSDAFFAVRLRS